MGIESIIAELGDKDGGVFLCPTCRGGSQARRTLSVHNREGVWLWLCHRASCNEKGARGASHMPVRSGFIPRVFYAPTRLPNWIQDKDPIAERIMKACPRIAPSDFAVKHGLRVLCDDHNVHSWLCVGACGAHLGYITRSESKDIRTYKEVDGAWYATFFPDTADVSGVGICLILEDPLSAAFAAECGVIGVALLGTHMTPETAADLTRCLPPTTRYIVALDPDEAGIGASGKIRDRLRARGAKVDMWRLVVDFKNYAPDERTAMIEDIRKYVL